MGSSANSSGGTPKATAFGGVTVSRPRELPVRTVRAQVGLGFRQIDGIGDVEQAVGGNRAGRDIQAHVTRLAFQALGLPLVGSLICQLISPSPARHQELPRLLGRSGRGPGTWRG